MLKNIAKKVNRFKESKTFDYTNFSYDLKQENENENQNDVMRAQTNLEMNRPDYNIHLNNFNEAILYN